MKPSKLTSKPSSFARLPTTWRAVLAELLIDQGRWEEAAREVRTVLLFEAEDPKLQELLQNEQAPASRKKMIRATAAHRLGMLEHVRGFAADSASS